MFGVFFLLVNYLGILVLFSLFSYFVGLIGFYGLVVGFVGGVFFVMSNLDGFFKGCC